MATYSFDTITDGQAQAYSAASDTLTFTTTVGSTALNTEASQLGDGSFVVLSNVSGRAVIFGAGLQGERLDFANGSVLAIGTSGSDTLTGGAGGDALVGGEASDVLIGGAGGDRLTGGGGGDVFDFRPGDSGVAANSFDTISDWQAGDFLTFNATAGAGGNFASGVAGDFAAALALANSQIAGGVIDYVAVTVGGNLIVFADSRGDNGGADDAVMLQGRSLGDLQAAAILARASDAPVGPPTPPPGDPGTPSDPGTPTTPPPPPPPTATPTEAGDTLVGAAGADTIDGLGGADTLSGRGGGDSLVGGAGADSLDGEDGGDVLQGGVGDDWLIGGLGRDTLNGGAGYDTFWRVSGDSAPAQSEPDVVADWSTDDRLLFSQEFGGGYIETTASDYLAAYGRASTFIAGGSARYVAVQVGSDVVVFADTLNNGGVGDAVVLTGRTLADISAFNIQGADGSAGGWAGAETVTLGSGSDTYAGGAGNDVLRGMDGYDSLTGDDGADQLFGGLADDYIDGGAGDDYLRGDEGFDRLFGGAGFDDINGNMGDDIASGGDGADWVVGGKDNDSLSGDAGDDIVYGNLGADTCEGGDGADLIRGGQGNDVLRGGADADWLSGDRGDDTVTGGAGADIFHGSQDAGVDWITDFNFAEGDRVVLDPGTTYELRQVGGDTWLYMGGNNQMVLAGVAAASLPTGWILS